MKANQWVQATPGSALGEFVAAWLGAPDLGRYCRTTRIRQLIQELRRRSDVGVVDEAQAWRLCITKGKDLFCEITVPHDVLEWHASVKQRRDQKTIWSDWMDYSGYDDRPEEQLQVEMVSDVLAFIDRVSTAKQLFPLKIYEERG